MRLRPRSSVRCRTSSVVPRPVFIQIILRPSANFSSNTTFARAVAGGRRGELDTCWLAGRSPRAGRYIHSAATNPAHPAIHSPPGETSAERRRDRSDALSTPAVLLCSSRRSVVRLIWRPSDWLSFPNRLLYVAFTDNDPQVDPSAMPVQADSSWLETSGICYACE